MDADTTNVGMSTPRGAEPQKYIRTFAGDMAVVQKGGVPDLAPLTSSTGPGPSAVASAPTPLPTAASPA